MRWLSRLRRRARLVVDRSAIEREMQEEMRFHLEMEAAELARLGNEDAWRAARRRFGGVARYQDDARDARGGRWLEELRQDARYALRVLGRGRGFAAVSVLTLALGVGANTAIFSVVRGVLLRQLPYADAERLAAAIPDAGGCRPMAHNAIRREGYRADFARGTVDSGRRAARAGDDARRRAR